MPEAAALPSAEVGRSTTLRRTSLLAALLTASVIAAGVTFPVATVLGVAVIFAATSRHRPLAAGAVVACLVALLSWINLGKTPSGDWLWYSLHYALLRDRPLDQYLGQTFYGISIEPTEPVYYTLAYLLANTTNANLSALSVSITVAIYGLISLAAYRVARLTALESRSALLAAIAVAMIGGVTFTLTTQLVRQELALAFLVAGMVLILSTPVRPWLAITIIVLATLTHNSALIPAAAVLAAPLTITPEGNFRVGRLAMLAVLFALAALTYLQISPPAYRTADDGAISLAVYALDGVLLGAFLVTQKSSEGTRRFASVTVSAIMLFGVFLAVISVLPLPFLRMYFYFEAFRILLLAALAASVFRSRYRAIAGPAFIVAAMLYFELRIWASAFDYEGGLLHHLFATPLLAAS